MAGRPLPLAWPVTDSTRDTMPRRYGCLHCGASFARSGRYEGEYCEDCRPTPEHECDCGRAFSKVAALNGHRAHCDGAE